MFYNDEPGDLLYSGSTFTYKLCFSLACHLRCIIFYLSAFLIWTAQFFSNIFQYFLVLHGLEGTPIHFILSSFKNELVRKITVVIFLRQCSDTHSS